MQSEKMFPTSAIVLILIALLLVSGGGYLVYSNIKEARLERMADISSSAKDPSDVEDNEANPAAPDMPAKTVEQEIEAVLKGDVQAIDIAEAEAILRRIDKTPPREQKRVVLVMLAASLHKTTELKPNNWEGWYLLAQTYSALAEEDAEFKEGGKYEEVVSTAYEITVNLNPKNEDVWSDFAEVYFSFSEDLADIDPEKSIAYFNKSENIYLRGLKILPESNFLWYMRGSDYSIHAYNVENPERRELREQAIGMFEQAVKYMPDDEYALRMWAKVYWRIADDLSNGDPELPVLWQQSYDIFLRAYAVTPARSAYPLATLGALLNKQPEVIERYLKEAKKQSELPNADELLEEPAFEPYLDEEWFKKFLD